MASNTHHNLFPIWHLVYTYTHHSKSIHCIWTFYMSNDCCTIGNGLELQERFNWRATAPDKTTNLMYLMTVYFIPNDTFTYNTRNVGILLGFVLHCFPCFISRSIKELKKAIDSFTANDAWFYKIELAGYSTRCRVFSINRVR